MGFSVEDLLLVMIKGRDPDLLTYSPAVDGQVRVAIWLVSASVGDRSGGTSRPTLAAFVLLSVKRNVCRYKCKHTDEVAYESLLAESLKYPRD